MFTLKGSRASALVTIDEIDESTRSQIATFLDSPAFAGSRIAIMPDCHAGKGAVIGLTMTTNDFVVPNIVGVDIGCGMLARRLAPEAAARFEPAAFDGFVRRTVPAGFEVNREVRSEVERELLERVDEEASRSGADRRRAALALGSLGGGNHFIEIDRDPEGGLWLVVHTGSRNFGKCVAEHYQARARAYCAGLRGAKIPRDLEYLPMEHRGARAYLAAMRLAQDYAARNRALVADRLLDFLGGPDERGPDGTAARGIDAGGMGALPASIESVHNYIDFEDLVVRKGAIPARAGQLCFIPFNMRDGSAICRGRGNPEYNRSAPHGAGRVMSRHQARRELSVERFRSSLREAGVYTSTAVEGTLDEAPEAYKSAALILGHLGPTVEVEALLRPVYNFKASGE